MFVVENGIVFENNISFIGSVGQICKGNEHQYLRTETDIEIIYQWQKFNCDLGLYENDNTNNTVINVNGTDFIPINGQVIINKTL